MCNFIYLLDQSDDDDDKTVNNRSKRKNAIPKFENYVYFMFAPTLIYKDDYPRSNILEKNVFFLF